MKNKSIIAILLSVLLLLSLTLTSCTKTESETVTESEPVAESEEAAVASNEGSETGTAAEATENSEEAITKVITDLTGAEVEIPVASEIDKVIIIAPPLVATFASVVGDTSLLVGCHPRAFVEANKDVLNELIPNWESINTSFLTGFTSNAEEVLNLDPDIILVYGDFQKDGLENVDIPVVDFYLDNTENESWSVEIDTLMREIFEIEDTATLQSEWDDVNNVVNTALESIDDSSKKTAVMIKSNSTGTITVRGANYYGDDWLIKTGLINCAGDLEGDGVEVTMEQFYEWNPDIIYIFSGEDASSYLANAIEGQDWSAISAFETGDIYDMPYGMFNWGAPNADSPLTLLWMTMKNYPDLIEENYYNQYMKDYYLRQYGFEITDETLADILDPIR